MTRKIAISHENPGSSRPFIGCNQRNEPGKQQFHREILAGVGHSPVISSQTNREKAILQLYPGRNSYFIYCVVARYTSLELISTITEPSHQALLLYFPCIFHASSTSKVLQKHASYACIFTFKISIDFLSPQNYNVCVVSKPQLKNILDL